MLKVGDVPPELKAQIMGGQMAKKAKDLEAEATRNAANPEFQMSSMQVRGVLLPDHAPISTDWVSFVMKPRFLELKHEHIYCGEKWHRNLRGRKSVFLHAGMWQGG